jgi:ATP-dependent exoDNAse (exonuclease V) beta subunit
MMTERVPEDRWARDQAIDTERSFIVQAPAGSGKTSLLTDRILRLLAKVEEPEQILAMTFTRKAAAEMHGRVMEKLRAGLETKAPEGGHDRQSWRLAQDVLANDRARGWDLIAHPARLRIQTIDAFCASLVRSMPWFSGLGGMPGIVQDARPLYAEAALRTLEAAGEETCVRQLLQHMDLNVPQAVQAIADMLDKRDHWLPLIRHAHDIEALQANLLAMISAQLLALSNAMPPGWQAQIAPSGAQVADYFVQNGQPDHPLTALLDWAPGALASIAPSPAHLDRWRALAELLLTGTGEIRKTLKVNNGCPPNSPQKKVLSDWLEAHRTGVELPDWAMRLHAVRLMPDPALTPGQWAILTAQCDTLLLAVGNLMVCFAQRGEVDFNEVSGRAVQALGGCDDPSDLLLKMDNRLSHILVDEFQDTSHTQLRLLELLTSGWQPDDGRTVFLVGDPMQSIYRFRKAEVGIFLRVQDEGLGGMPLETLTLTANFRSQAGIVQWVNQTFSQIFPQASDPDMGAIAYSEAQPWHPPGSHEAVQWHLVSDMDEGCGAVVEIARHALQAFPDSKSPMAVLVRSRGSLGNVVGALLAAGFDCRAVELVPLRERAVVVDLLQLARAMSHPADRAAWLAVLRAPWCGLTLGTLHSLLVGQGERAVLDCLTQALSLPRPSTIDEDQWQRLVSTVQQIVGALNDDGAQTFAARLESTWRALEGHRLVSEASELADAQAFFRLVEGLAKHSYIDVDELEQKLGQLFAEPTGGERAISVMTMHKAKGLQFGTVVLFGLDRKPKPDQPPLIRIEQSGGHLVFGPIKASTEPVRDLLSDYLAHRESARMSYETDRLLYVAATRAEESLHLVGVVGPDKKDPTQWATPSQSSLLSRLWPFRPAGGPLALLEDLSEDLNPAKPHWVAPSMHRRVASPSLGIALPGIESPSPGSTQTFSGQPFAWSPMQTAERLSGIVVHAWLAHFCTQNVDPEKTVLPSLEVLQQQLRLLGMPSPLRVSAALAIQQTLSAMLASDKGRWLLSQPLRQSEWALIDAQQTISVIDLAIDLGESWLIVDYKTSRPGKDEPLALFSQRMMARYRPQLERYVEQLQSFDGRAAKAALYFPQDDLWLELQAQEPA